MFSKKAVTSVSSSGQRRLWSACQVPKVAPSRRGPVVAAREGLSGRGKALRRSSGEGHRSLEATVERRGRGRRAPSPHTCQQTPRRHSAACGGSWDSAGTNTDFRFLQGVPLSDPTRARCPAPAPRRSWGDRWARVRGRTRYGWQSAEGCAPLPVSLVPARSVLPWGPPAAIPRCPAVWSASLTNSEQPVCEYRIPSREL